MLTASQPFTTKLISSNMDMFKYDLIWHKTVLSGSLNANKMPLRIHESILLFYKKLPVFNPQYKIKTPYSRVGGKPKTSLYNKIKFERNTINKTTRNPTSIIIFSNSTHNKIHPAQKPIELFEYFVNTYTNENETILDNCLGTGTTSVAAENLNQNSIGIEILQEWCEKSYDRLLKIVKQTKLDRIHSIIEKIGF